MSISLKNFLSILCLVLGLLSLSCATRPAKQFNNAVADAAIIQEKDVYTHLISIENENNALIWSQDKRKIKVVTWKSLDSFNAYYKDQNKTSPLETRVTWVTTAPQVQMFGREYIKKNPFASKEQLELRLKQYLGLNPEWIYDVFIELWVKPEDLFRPCVDPEINDSQCNIAFSKEEPKVKNLNCYPCFYKNLYFNDFRTRPGIPWSGMGYTYDWGNPGHPFGASEFILVPSAAYEIVRAVKTVDYIQNL